MSVAGFVGADPDQLDGLAASFDRAADSLDGVRTSVGGTFGRVWWEGRDGDQARGDWRGRHDTAIAAACAALREAAKSLRANAAQQRGASGSTGGPVSGQGAGHNAGHGGGPGLGTYLHAWAGDSRDLIAGGQGLTFSGDLLAEARHLGSGFAPGPLDRLALGFDVAELAVQLHDGDVHGGTLVHTALGIAQFTPLYPYAAAADTGIYLGEHAADFLQEHTQYQNKIADFATANMYGGDMTPTEAQAVNQRWSGPMAYVHITEDVGAAAVQSLGQGATSLWNTLFH